MRDAIAVAMLMVVCTVVAFVLLSYVYEAHPLRRWRKMRTPSCLECKHGADNGAEFVCYCPQAIDARERGVAQPIDKVPAHIVRGTRYCKFEREEGGE